VTTHGRYTGIIRNSNVFDQDAQDFPGVDFAAGLYRANLRRNQCVSNLSALTSGVMTSVALFLREGDVVTNLTFVSATTAAGTPTAWWFALYDTASTPALLGQTADQTTTAWAANTAMTKALSSPVTISTTGIHYAAVMVAATTAPTLAGVALHNAVESGAIITGEKVLARTSGSSLTTTAPSTIASPTTVATIPLVIAT
jgi:hypothetical protein